MNTIKTLKLENPKLNLKVNPTQKIFFSSDTHFLHKNICKGSSNWNEEKKRELRDFIDQYEMTTHIINNFNEKIGENDILFLGGDYCFGGHENIPIIRKKINCRNIFLVYGNHDEHLVRNTNNYRNLFVYCSNYINMSINEQKVCISHYPMYVWDSSHKGSYQLHGHCHNSLNDYVLGKTLDVGVDAYFKMFGSYNAFSWDEINEYMDKREIIYIDHHDKREK